MYFCRWFGIVSYLKSGGRGWEWAFTFWYRATADTTLPQVFRQNNHQYWLQRGGVWWEIFICCETVQCTAATFDVLIKQEHSLKTQGSGCVNLVKFQHTTGWLQAPEGAKWRSHGSNTRDHCRSHLLKLSCCEHRRETGRTLRQGSRFFRSVKKDIKEIKLLIIGDFNGRQTPLLREKGSCDNITKEKYFWHCWAHKSNYE